MSTKISNSPSKAEQAPSSPKRRNNNQTPTILENESFKNVVSDSQQQDQATVSKKEKRKTNTTGGAVDGGLSARAVHTWDLKMGIIKKHMVGGVLLPTVYGNAVSAFLGHKTRRVTIEIRTPLPSAAAVAPTTTPTSPTSSTTTAATTAATTTTTTTPRAAPIDSNDPMQIVLGNQDTAVLKVLRKKRRKKKKPASKKGGLASASASEDDDDSVDDDDDSADESVVSALSSRKSDPGDAGRTTNTTAEKSDMKDWKTRRVMGLEDVTVLRSFGRTLEIKSGVSLDQNVRDFRFNTEEDAKLFAKFLERIRKLEKERAQRQISEYREKLSTAALVVAATTGSNKLAKTDANSKVAENNSTHLINILVEIVSAKDIPIADLSSTDPYVVVNMFGKEIHKTKYISKELNPIWTLHTDSLFLVSMTPEEFFSASGGMTFILRDFDTIGKDDQLGKVNVSLEELLNGTGERMEYDIWPLKNFSEKNPKPKGKMYLRFKQASKDEIEFMQIYTANKDKDGVYGEETYFPIKPPQSKFLKRQFKKLPNGTIVHRTRPYPDPDREAETTYMSTEQLELECKKPSTNWVACGSGDLGKLYVEVLKAQDLPNMDFYSMNPRDRTDAFCCMVFEDSIVNTDAIGDSLNPRWVPWCHRAFVFNISHPSSKLLISLLDYDDEHSPLQLVSRATSDLHDPVGRITLNISNYSADTIYTLGFDLRLGETKEYRDKSEGKIWIRLRIEWADAKKAIMAAMSAPEMTYVSVARAIDFDVAHYTCEGIVNEDEFNLKLFTDYISELLSYLELTDLIKEGIMNTVLWRGHKKVTFQGKSYLLPLHSITAFTWGVLVTNNFSRYPSFLLFSVAWILLACNEYQSKNPSPWKKPRDIHFDMIKYYLGEGFNGRTVQPNYMREEQLAFEEQRKKKWDRWREQKAKEAEEEEQFRKDLGLDVADPDAEEKIATQKGGFKLGGVSYEALLKPVLYPIQQIMATYVINLRVVTSVVVWNDAYTAFWIVNFSLAGSLLLFFIPFTFIFRWTLRILVWVGLGPWMALVDKYYLAEDPNLTEEQRTEMIRQQGREKYKQLLLEASNFDIRRERAQKLKSMTKYMFGRFLVRVPRFNEELFQDYPLLESYAEPYSKQKSPPVVVKQRKYGQALSGDMIPKRCFQVEDKMQEPKSLKSLATVAVVGNSFKAKMAKQTKAEEETPLFNDTADGGASAGGGGGGPNSGLKGYEI